MSNRRKAKRKPPTDEAIYYRDGSCILHGIAWPAPRNTSADELWKRLVDDGVKRIPTPAVWLLEAVSKIARSKGTGREDVFVDLDETVRARCGMPLSREPGSL